MTFRQLKQRLELYRHFLFIHLSATGIRTEHIPSWSKIWAIAAPGFIEKTLNIAGAFTMERVRAANVAVVLSLTNQHDYECLDGNSHQNQQDSISISAMGNCRWGLFARYSSLRAPDMLSLLHQFKVCRRLERGCTRTPPPNSFLRVVPNLTQPL